MTKELSRTQVDILKAAELLSEQGWCRGVEKDERSRHCIFGAVRETVDPDEVMLWTTPEYTRMMVATHVIANAISDTPHWECLREMLQKLGCPPTSANIIAHWNDMFCRSRRQAVELMQRAAAREEARGAS